MAFGNESQYRTSDSKLFIYDDLATSCKHLVNFGPVTQEFKRVKVAHRSSISSLATFALLLDVAGISAEFSGAITTQFCFTYALEDVTAMRRRGLHAELCHNPQVRCKVLVSLYTIFRIVLGRIVFYFY